MFRLLSSVLRRLTTAVTSPLRRVMLRVLRLFNVNLITARLVAPLTKMVHSLITLRPQSRSDYFVVGRWWIYKKLLLVIVLALCAGVLIYFMMFAPKLPAAAPAIASVQTAVTYDYDDMELRKFSGVCNIRAADGAVVYTGDVSEGVCTGNGTLYDRKGRLEYEGGFEQNRFSGKGVYYYPDGAVRYDGEWADNSYSGTGTLYSPQGRQLYAGSFQRGLYEGEGKLWDEDGTLLYEGAFSAGRYHGQGVSYYGDGAVRYEGEFHGGTAQGQGSFYSQTGRLLYTGSVHGGMINYRALAQSSFADVKAAFPEAPRVFYTETDSAFVFEQAGAVVTVDCRVMVDAWERPQEQREGYYYYMPGEEGVAPDAQQAGPDSPADSGTGGWYLETGPVLPVSAPRRFGAVSPMGWYVAQDNFGTYDPPSQSPSSQAQPPSSAEEGFSSDSPSSPEPSPSSPPPESSSPESSSPESSSSSPPAADPYPDFVEKTQKLYFEIDRNVWQSEEELDAEKVRVKKVTAFSGELPAVPEGAVEFAEDAPPYLEDCIAVDFIRLREPTAFPQVIFEADRQNRLFVRLQNISFASRIVRRSFAVGDLTYRYAYQEGGEDPLYFSVER